MRYASPWLALSASLAAQQPPVLATTPPAQSSQFGAAAFGGGVTQVAQLSMIRDAGAGNWYVTAAVTVPPNPFFTGWSGRATGTPGNYTLTANNDLANLPPPTTDYFAFNVTSDLKVLVFEAGASVSPQVYVRTAINVPFTLLGVIPGVTGYVDSQVGSTLASWNGTTGGYEFIYARGNSLLRAPLTLTAPSTVTLGAPVTMATIVGVVPHSPSPLRQNTGLPSDRGTCRALMFARNNSSADAFFRSSLAGDSLANVPGLQVYDDSNWKSNPGHIGGSMYWAYHFAAGYRDPLQLDTVCMSSAHPPAAGGMLTICAWAPPKATAQLGFVMLGTLDPLGLDLSFLGITGRLGLGLPGLTFLPTQPFDPTLGEMSYTFHVGPLGRAAIHMQVGDFDLALNRIFLGNNAVIKTI